MDLLDLAKKKTYKGDDLTKKAGRQALLFRLGLKLSSERPGFFAESECNTLIYNKLSH